jgi:hypothetical protein
MCLPVDNRSVNQPLFPTRPERDVYTVSRLNKEVRLLLESGMPLLWLEGELSNFAAPASGHWYFTLKDSQAQVRCAMWRQRNSAVKFRPKDGLAVLVRARWACTSRAANSSSSSIISRTPAKARSSANSKIEDPPGSRRPVRRRAQTSLARRAAAHRRGQLAYRRRHPRQS